MTKKLAKQIASLWNEKFAGITEETKTIAVVEEPTLKLHYAKSWHVSIIPAGSNDGRAFYHTEEFVDVKRAFKLSGFVHIEDGKCVGNLY